MNEDLVIVGLARQRYAVLVRQVREVLPRATLTALPGAPAGLLGILSLRGSLLPVLDLRQLLSLPAAQARVTQCILVVELARSTVGLLVDAVVGIVVGSQTETATARGEPAELIREVAEIDGQVVSILDPDVAVGPVIAGYVAAIATGPAALADVREARVEPQRTHG